jgi:hypothetical protein
VIAARPTGGILAGFTNRKAKYFDASTGLYPFVRLIEVTGGVYPDAERFLAAVKSDLKRRQVEREQLRPLLVDCFSTRARAQLAVQANVQPYIPVGVHRAGRSRVR